MATLRYRLALDLGSTSLGWTVLQLKEFSLVNQCIFL